jgi:lysophospholipase L1-like esterase
MKVVFRLVAVLFGLIFPILLLEIAFKWLDVREAREANRIVRRVSRVSEVPGVRFELVPSVESPTPGQTQVVRINRHGFRGRDVALEKPPGTERIVVLGDSIGFGRTLPEEEIFPTILERLLNERGGRRVEVVNASLSGRDTWEEAAMLRHRLLAFEPDLVLLQICLNDHVRLPYPEEGSPLGAFGERDWWTYSSLLAALDRRFPAFHRLHVAALDALGLRRSSERVILDHFIDPKQMLNVDPNWTEWSRVLLEIRDLARSGGGDVLFVVFPIRLQAERGDEQTLPRLTAFAGENGIPLVDLAPIFREDPAALYQDHIHPTAEGNRRVAAAIAERLLGQDGRATAAAAPQG